MFIQQIFSHVTPVVCTKRLGNNIIREFQSPTQTIVPRISSVSGFWRSILPWDARWYVSPGLATTFPMVKQQPPLLKKLDRHGWHVRRFTHTRNVNNLRQFILVQFASVYSGTWCSEHAKKINMNRLILVNNFKYLKYW